MEYMLPSSCIRNVAIQRLHSVVISTLCHETDLSQQTVEYTLKTLSIWLIYISVCSLNVLSDAHFRFS